VSDSLSRQSEPDTAFERMQEALWDTKAERDRYREALQRIACRESTEPHNLAYAVLAQHSTGEQA
jgi:hypothetical protein